MKFPYLKSGNSIRGRRGALADITRGSLIALIVIMATGIAGCFDDYSSGPTVPPAAPPIIPPVRVLSSIRITIPDTIEIGEIITARADGFDQFGDSMRIGAVFSAARSGVVVAGDVTGLIFGVEPGSTEIIARVGDVEGQASITVVKPQIRINEVVTNGLIPGGFVELINPGDRDVDLGGFALTTLDVLNFIVLPPGFMIPAHGYQVVSEIHFPNGLGPSDEVRLFSKWEMLLDRFNWVGNPQQDYSRCPELNGPFLVSVPTRRAANDCENATATTSSLLSKHPAP